MEDPARTHTLIYPRASPLLLRLSRQASMRLKLSHKGGWVSDVRWHPHQPHLLASACYDGAVRLWDVRTTIPLHTVAQHDGKALCVIWDGAERVASGGTDAQLRLSRFALP